MRNFALLGLFLVLFTGCSLPAVNRSPATVASRHLTKDQAQCLLKTRENCRRERQSRVAPLVLFSLESCETRMANCYR